MVSHRLGQGWQEARGTGRRALAGGWSSGRKTTPTSQRGAAKVLVMAALAGALIMGAGCNSSQLKGGSLDELRMRPPAMETARLLRNAHYYKLMGRPEASLKEMEQAHRQDPDNLKIVDTLAQTYQELGQFQRAQELYQEALARQGSNRALQNNWCFSFYLQGDLAKAETCFKDALARDPGNAAARNNLGLLWCRQGKLAEAQRLWEETEGTAAAENRLNQALAFLGKSPPARIAKAAEPKAAPAPRAAVPAKATAPVIAASPAKPVVAETKTPVKAPVQPAAVPPKAEVRVAVKAAEPKAAPAPRTAAPAKPAAPVIAASPAKPVVAETKTPVKAPVQPAVVPPKAQIKKTVKPVAPSPPLTVAEREAGIEVRNGVGTKDLAHLTRTLLSREGFNVVQIGNHIDFGAEATVIYYQDGAQRVAQALNAEIFPEARLERSAQLKDGVAVRVLLGHDLANQPRVMARLTGETLAEASPAVKAKAPEARLRPQAGASQGPAAPINGATPAKAGPDKRPIPPAATAGPAAPNQAAAETAAPKGPLTAEELITTLIEIRNGTRSQNLAHRTRSLLSREGFSVGIIGNHIDFGAEVTEIYYRPGAEKVARALNSKIFPEAKLTPSSRLKKGMAIKVVLGRDLLDRTLLMSMLKE